MQKLDDLDPFNVSNLKGCLDNKTIKAVAKAKKKDIIKVKAWQKKIKAVRKRKEKEEERLEKRKACFLEKARKKKATA